MFVGASNVPSVVRANALVVADCRTVRTSGLTIAQLPAPRRVRAAIVFAFLLIRTARAACSSPTNVAVPLTPAWLKVSVALPARLVREAMISWSISAVISCARACMISASTSRPCIDCASCAASKVQRALSLRVFASTVCFSTWMLSFLPAVPSSTLVASARLVLALPE